MNDELPGITTTKTFFRSGDLDVASIDWEMVIMFIVSKPHIQN